jgi:hypothetical protein
MSKQITPSISASGPADFYAAHSEASEEWKLSTYYSTRGDSGTIYPVPVDSVSPNGVTGVLAVTFTEPTHAYVRTEGHLNDNLTILTYRSTEFLVSAHLYKKGDRWELGSELSSGKATRRDNWSDATPTQKSKLMETVVAVMNAYADTPEFIATRKAGTEYNARIDLDSAEREVSKLEDQLKIARAARRKAKVRHDAALLAISDPGVAERPPFRTRGPQS